MNNNNLDYENITYKKLYHHINNHYIEASSDIITNQDKSEWVKPVISLILLSTEENIADVKIKFQGIIGSISNTLGYDVLNSQLLFQNYLPLIQELKDFNIHSQEQAINAIKLNPIFFDFINDKIKTDIAFCYEAIMIDQETFKYFHPVMISHFSLNTNNAKEILSVFATKIKKSFFSFINTGSNYNPQEIVNNELITYNNKIKVIQDFINKTKSLNSNNIQEINDIVMMLNEISRNFRYLSNIQQMGFISTLSNELIPSLENINKTNMNNKSKPTSEITTLVSQKIETYYKSITQSIENEHEALLHLVKSRPI